MAKEDLIEMSGVVLEVLPDARYRVKLDNGHELVAYTNGKCVSTTFVFWPVIKSLWNCPLMT